jgi:DNA-binding NtrC family response regulator
MDHPLIVVVDDEQDLLDNFKVLLSEQFHVETFSRPRDFLEALPQLKSKGLRLLISDFKMPGLSGLEMIQKAHVNFPGLPFILLSGYLDKKTVLEAVEMGAFRLLEKPCLPHDLIASIDQLLVEADLADVRREIRNITSQLRELYSSVRLALMQYIPEDVMERLVIEAPLGQVVQTMSFEDLLEKLEHRLDLLLSSEKVINELRDSRWKQQS